MSTASSSKTWTWEEALALPDGERYEVINGELKERTMSFGSSSIAARLAGFLFLWIRAGHPGTVAGSDGGYTIFPWAPGDVRMPDVSYVSKARLPKAPRRGWSNVAPELAVEIVSPNDQLTAAEDKARDYIRAGVDLVWVVYPPTQSVQVWRADGSRSVLQAGEALSGEAVLPGFALPIAELFEDLDEDA